MIFLSEQLIKFNIDCFTDSNIGKNENTNVMKGHVIFESRNNLPAKCLGTDKFIKYNRSLKQMEMVHIVTCTL